MRRADAEDKPIDDPQLEAVHRFAALVVDNRGWVADADVKALLDAGFTRRQVLDILTGVAMKTMSNYTNHLARTPPRGLGGVLMDRVQSVR